MNHIDNDITLTFIPKSSTTKWLAVDDNNEILAEGQTPDEVIAIAKKSGRTFTVMFVPIEGSNYIF